MKRPFRLLQGNLELFTKEIPIFRYHKPREIRSRCPTLRCRGSPNLRYILANRAGCPSPWNEPTMDIDHGKFRDRLCSAFAALPSRPYQQPNIVCSAYIEIGHQGTLVYRSGDSLGTGKAAQVGAFIFCCYLDYSYIRVEGEEEGEEPPPIKWLACSRRGVSVPERSQGDSNERLPKV